MGIDQYNVLGGVDSMVSVRFTPWHRTNFQRVEHLIRSAHEAMVLGGIDWQVERTPLFVPTGIAAAIMDPEYHLDVDDLSVEELRGIVKSLRHADEHTAVVRGDNGFVLGVHSSAYGLLQNDQIEQLAQAVLDVRPDAHIESAGALYKGKVVWVLVRLQDEDVAFGEGYEKLQRYVLVYKSHDGSHPLVVRATNVRVECMNTFAMATKGQKAFVRVKHTKNAEDYATVARDSLKFAVANFRSMEKEIEQLLNKPISSIGDFAKKVLGEKKADEGRGATLWDQRFNAIVAEYHADHNANVLGTAWGAVMAVNGYELWAQGTRGQGRADAQFARLLGDNFDLTDKARGLALAL